jgi:nucleotide-binding universal stress UspA family protein
MSTDQDQLLPRDLVIKTVLIPVDGSAHAHKAAFIGANIAAKFGARVVLLHIMLRHVSFAKICDLAEKQRLPADVLETLNAISEPIVYDAGLGAAGPISPIVPADVLLKIGWRVLEVEQATVKAQDVKAVSLVMEDDDAAEKIIATATKEKADVIVMGRRGLGAFRGMLSGSVSTKVSHLAELTVISVT